MTDSTAHQPLAAEQRKQRDRQLLIGASWYPEMWPEDEWPRDIARMDELGFNVVRLFEFAWKRFEPREGEFDFDWSLRLLDQLHEAGIAAMIGTPSAAPPAWLTTKYPEVLKVGPDGARRRHGQRRHGSHTSRQYRKLCRRIVKQMVRHFADHPAVHSWQIDNEMGGSDYSDETARRFRKWLRQRYINIDRLNDTWGLHFWSQGYDDFDQINLPRASVGAREIQERDHPSLIIAFARFNADEWTDFIAEQCDVIRDNASQPITTNMVKGLGMHWYQHNRVLDRVGHSLYADVDHYAWQFWCFDRMRAEKRNDDGSYRPYWLLETAPNWSGGGRLWNIHHDAAGLKNITWHSTLLGGSMVLYWQWRQHWAGQEMQHGTCVTATGKWRPNKEAWTQLATQFGEQSDWLLTHPPKQAEVGLVLSNEAAWSFSIDPVDDGMEYATRWRDDFHLPLVRSHIWRDVIHESTDFDQYKVLLLPLMPIVAEETKTRLQAWVEQGGCLLLGPITGTRTEEFTIWREDEFGGLESLIGAVGAAKFTPMWVDSRATLEFADAHRGEVKTWCEAFEPTSGKPIAWYRQPATEDGLPAGYGDGGVAVVRHRLGKGTVITLGCRTDEATTLKLIGELMSEAGVRPIAQGSGDVLVVPRADHDGNVVGYGVVNTTEQPRSVTLPEGGVDRLTGENVAATLQLPALAVRIIEVK